MSRDGHFFSGFLWGALIATGISLLYAPQSGEETRKRLRQLKEENEDLLLGTKNKTEALIERTKSSIEEGFDKLARIIEDNKKVSPVNTNSKAAATSTKKA